MPLLDTLFGFIIKRKPSAETKSFDRRSSSFVTPDLDDGAVTVDGFGRYSTYIDLEGSIKSDYDLITRYRQMAMMPEVAKAVEHTCNDAVVIDSNQPPVTVNTDQLNPEFESIKKKVAEEFDNVLRLLGFKTKGYSVFRRWYIDGRLYYHILIDEKKPTAGIQEVRYIDPRQIRKVREVEREKDPQTGVDVVVDIKEYYVYSPRGIMLNGVGDSGAIDATQGLKISPDSVAFCHSGIVDEYGGRIYSYLHNAIRPSNQLRMIEDALVIYRISRAPERRIFYIDVGNLPRQKGEEYLKHIRDKYRNKMTYDATTGEVRDSRQHMSMLEDFWLPRREGAATTEITTLPGGQNLGEIQDIEYFQQKLYQSLAVPVRRLQPEDGFTLGQVAAITREELNFNLFIIRLRNQFSTLFNELLKRQLLLKRICTEDDWKRIEQDLMYDFRGESYFAESKDTEIAQNRISLLDRIVPYEGKYFSKEYIRKNVLQMTDDEIKAVDEQMKNEAENSEAFGQEGEDEFEPNKVVTVQHQRPPGSFEDQPKPDFSKKLIPEPEFEV